MIKKLSLFTLGTYFANTAASALAAAPTAFPAIPVARPPTSARMFVSPAVDDFISSMKAKIDQSTDLGKAVAQMFENCYASTLDTTVAWTDFTTDVSTPLSFVITGDIPAMWLRDSMNQVLHYIPLISSDPNLNNLIKGVINLQARYLTISPFSNAFKAPPESGINSGSNNWAAADQSYPQPNYTLVWEDKYELDSLSSFFKLVTTWWDQMVADDDDSRMDICSSTTLQPGVDITLTTMENMAKSNVDNTYYWFKRTSDATTETVPNSGMGNPVLETGMVMSMFRPSDDSTIFPFLVPSNMMSYVALNKLAAAGGLLDSCGWADEKSRAQAIASGISSGLLKYAVVAAPPGFTPDADAEAAGVETLFAFEVDGRGGINMMDDANVPSLLSAPDLQFVNITADPPTATETDKTFYWTYVNTRKWLLSTDNGWYADGTYAGVGSPHTGMGRPWMMGFAMEGLTMTPDATDQDYTNILTKLVQTQANTGLMHESIDVENPSYYSRQWFAWANTVFGQLIMEMYQKRPDLSIFIQP